MKIYLTDGRCIVADKLTTVIQNANAMRREFCFEYEIFSTGEKGQFQIEEFDYAIDAQSEDNERSGQ